eukprot:jgi/Bigna1/71265/fgenesh1_pg.15_\
MIKRAKKAAGKKKGKRKARSVGSFGEGGTAGKKSKKKRKQNPGMEMMGGGSKAASAATRSAKDEPLSEGLKLLSSKNPKRGREFFAWLIHPMPPSEFMKEYFEKKHLLIRRSNRKSTKGTGEEDSKDDDGEGAGEGSYFSGLYSSERIREALDDSKFEIKFSRDIDIVKYIGGKRRTLNPAGDVVATGDFVWKKLKGGCSLRVLRPQEYNREVYRMVSLMDEYWGRVSGANAYLTPPSTQGFAPHYDDVDVYIVQLEGRKRWRLYPPRDNADVLPRFSSQDIDESDLPEPILDTVLNPGDLLYAPRGTIHQAIALPNGPASLHLTLSSGQRHTWADYFSLLVPRAVQLAAEEDSSFRESLPISFHDYMGVVHADSKSCGQRRERFKAKAHELLEKLLQDKFLALDAAADQMARDFIHGRVPPLEAEKDAEAAGKEGGAEGQLGGDEAAGAGAESHHADRSRGTGCARLIMEEEAAVLYYCTRNSKVFKEREEQYLPFADHCAPALERLIEAFPRYVAIGELEGLTKEEQLVVANVLYQAGVVIAKSG